MRTGLGVGLLAVVASFVAVAACAGSDGSSATGEGSPNPDGGAGSTPTSPIGTTTTPPSGDPDSGMTQPDGAAPDSGAPDSGTPSDPSIGDPDTFAATDAVDVEEDIDTTDNTQRRAISPLIYGLNSYDVSLLPAEVLKSVTFIRRGGDRVNTYDWETNLSANSREQDLNTATNNYDYLPGHITGDDRKKPAIMDLDMISRTKAAGIGAMVPFTLDDYVSKKAGNADWNSWTLTTPARTNLFDRVHPVSTSPFLAEPDLTDNAVYADEHFAYLKSKLGDIYAPGGTRVLVGTDNEPDIYKYNYPFLQAGKGQNLYAEDDNGNRIGTTVVGKLVDADQFVDEKFIPFAKRVKELDPNAFVVGPDHYHYDGFTTWDVTMTSGYSDKGDGAWVMDHFLDKVKAASDTAGKRLLDVWDFHWYPQYTFTVPAPTKANPNATKNVEVEYLTGNETPAALAGVLNTPREFWDDTFSSNAWYADQDHTAGPTYILKRIKEHVAAHYPGTPIGVSEYWPGGSGTIYNGLGVADTLGIFQRMDVTLGAMWPDGNTDYAFGAFRLLRNADGNGLKFAGTYVPVTNPAADAKEKAERSRSSVYAGSDDKTTMTVLVINKTANPRGFGLRAKHSALLKTVDVFRIDAANKAPLHVGADPLTKKNAYLYSAPAYSASLLVFKN